MRGLIEVSPEEKQRCIAMIRATFVTSTCCNEISSEDIDWLANEIWINAISNIMLDYQPDNLEDKK